MGITRREENILGTTVVNAALTGSVSISLDSFSSYRGTLTGNTNITFTDTPASGFSKVRAMELSGNFTLTFNDANYTVGSYSGTATRNLVYLQFDNFSGTLSVKVSYENIA